MALKSWILTFFLIPYSVVRKPVTNIPICILNNSLYNSYFVIRIILESWTSHELFKCCQYHKAVDPWVPSLILII